MDDVTVNTAGEFVDKNVGDGKTVTVSLTLEGAKAANYSVPETVTTTANIFAKVVSATGITASNKTYDGTTAATVSGGTIDGVIGGDNVTVDLSGATASFEDKDAGENKNVNVTGIALGGASAGNYVLSETTVTLKANITKIALAVIADNKKIKVGDSLPELTYQITSGSFIIGEGFTAGTLTVKDYENAVGTYDIVAEPAFDAGGNYEIIFTKGTLTVSAKEVKKLTASIDNLPDNLTYGDDINLKINVGIEGETTLTGTPEYTVDDGGSDVISVDADGNITIIGVGTAVITVNLPDDETYSYQDVTVSLNVGKKALTIDGLIVDEKAYDGTTTATVSGGTLSGVVGNDDVSFSEITANFASTAAGEDITVTLSDITLTGADASKYELTQPTGLTGTITKAKISITSINADNMTAVISGIVGQDDVELDLEGATFTFGEIGEEVSPVTVSGLALKGDDAANYELESDTFETSVSSENIVTLTFSSQNGSISGAESGDKFIKGVVVTLTAEAASGYNFSRWIVNGETAGTSEILKLKMDADKAVTAEFTKRTSSGSGGSSNTLYSVIFNTNGGSKIATQKVKRNGTASEPEDPIREGYIFDGWYTSESFTKLYDFSSKITKSINLYAKWTAKSDNGGDNSGNEENKDSIILTIDETEAYVFGELVENDVAPKILNDRTMIPIRFVAEALGSKVSWNDSLKKVTIERDDVVIEIFIGSNVAYVNGNVVVLDIRAFIEHSRTYCPVRFVSEALNSNVEWKPDTKQVIITKK